LLSRVILGLPK